MECDAAASGQTNNDDVPEQTFPRDWDELLSLFYSRYTPEWSFYEVIEDYLQFLISCKHIPQPSSSEEVSNYFVDLCNIINASNMNLEPFVANILFHTFYSGFSQTINEILAKSNIKIVESNDQKLRIISAIKKKRSNKDKNVPDKSIKLQNSFSVLDSIDDGDIHVAETRPTPVSTNSNVNNVASGSPVPRKQYQLFFEIGKNCKQQIQHLHALSNDLNIEFTRNMIKISTNCADAFRAAQNYLVTNKIPARALDLKSAKPLKFIIRGLPLFTDVADIDAALREHNITPIKIAYLTNRRTKQPMPLFLATVQPSPAVNNIENIKTINYLTVKFETYKAKGVAQCYRCQQYGHSSLNCNLTPKCLKCGESHRSNQCQKGPDQFKCANCGGGHTANFRGCPAHPINRKTGKNVKTRSVAPKFVPSPPPQTNIWAQRAQNSKKSETPHINGAPTQTIPTHLNRNLEGPEAPPSTSKNAPKAKISQISNKNKDKQASNKEPQASTSKHSQKLNNSGQKKSKSENTSSASSIMELLKTIQEIMKEFNINDILGMFKSISQIMKSEKDTFAKIYEIFELISETFNAETNDG